MTQTENNCDNQQNGQDWEDIFNSFYDGVWVADGEGRTIMVNESYEKLTNIKKEDVLGKYAHNLVKAGVLSQSAIPGVISTLKPVTIINKLNNKQLLVTGVPVFFDGKLHRVVCNVRDITQLTDLQKEIEQKNELINHYEMEISKFKGTLGKMEEGPVIRNEKMVKLFEVAHHVSSTQSTIIILGESGVGKEVLANWIHNHSPRSKKPFMKVNCSAIPENLIESELFGYEAGAFTGATKRKLGVFELSNEGTIFLDEIGELPLNMQAKLLRVLQEKEVQRIGGGKPIPINIRVVAATNRSLEKMIAEGTFREDLYYRLNVVPFILPPLRERREEIPILATHFLSQFNQMYQRKAEFGPVIMKRLMQYHWPGNVRELKNMIERMVVMSKDNLVNIDILSEYIDQTTNPPSSSSLSSFSEQQEGGLNDLVMDFEKKIILDILRQSKSIRQAAGSLQISHSTLIRKLQSFKIDYLSFLGKGTLK
ncbi:sigma-54-dependent Fis family transcriptional regulator [Ammoniphilus sp. YIM 78166]|uniref:sigma-54 interaction domain-containing protein n=1 Tax=Ammoniphilus sp. YIM 78166 TaxID=1644106 RepID=UPI00106F7101|nr:sigma 54-interacting transcriptional regulator [Ammoniphilus sp. YIM 78166]